ncbi:signal recognition particle protein [Acidimicrobiaceae bacterium USS-CC1]|uniref:Signal recognition particle protein n=1 Tax=Acidiferrimicrobium australe TaxID=2664430 RepID=A0ABW9QP26_9ACTN|nr:signal recognition particle protein [Acidiferrimicrobium australe]
MFESLTDRFDGIFTRLRGKGRLSEADVDEALREIRLALLQADVNLRVVRDFVTRVRDQLVGADLSASLTPGQQVVKVVHDELRAILGGEALRITFAPRPPTVILLAGLQGAGKTTTAGKLAAWFRKQGRQPLLVGADLQRPAAVEQLRILGAEAGVPVFSEASDPVTVASRGLDEARRLGKDVLIVDTAGRLSIDAELMDEVRRVSEVTDPHYTFLVIDAMTGQDAVSTAEAFHKTLALDGVIITKIDGDARGGAALSVKEVVGRPIVFASTGEKQSDFDLFHPDRMADRILGMGDVLSLIEKAEAVVDQAEAERAMSRLQEGSFTLEDFLEQMQQLKKMGPLSGLVGMIPGLPKEIRNAEVDDDAMKPIEAIIHSMTPEERRNPGIINGSRRSRIARGSGTTTAEVNGLLDRFKQMQSYMKGLSNLPGIGRRMSKATAKSGRKSNKKKKRGR